MKKIFIIKSAFAEKEGGLTNKSVWSNIYAVEDEMQARKDCIKFQNDSNKFYIGGYKFYYIYEELEMF